MNLLNHSTFWERINFNFKKISFDCSHLAIIYKRLIHLDKNLRFCQTQNFYNIWNRINTKIM